MNTNSTPAELSTSQDGVIHEAAAPTADPDQLQPPTPTQESPSIARHRRKCAICNHPDCEAIEDAYLNWISPYVIFRDFKLGDRSTLYRHADANGLPTLRRRRMHLALDRLIERADSAPITGNTVIRAIMFSHQLTQQEQSTNPTEIDQRNQTSQGISNRHTKFLESPITQTK